MLDPLGIGAGRKAEPAREPPDMGIHRNRRLGEDMTQNHVGRLAPDAGKRGKLFNRLGQAAIRALYDGARRID